MVCIISYPYILSLIPINYCLNPSAKELPELAQTPNSFPQHLYADQRSYRLLDPFPMFDTYYLEITHWAKNWIQVS